MSDAKLSELTVATTATGTDSLYVVQSNTSKKITVANLFATIATPVAFTDKIKIQDSETISAPGALSVNTNLSVLTNPSTTGNITIGSGSEGQLKIVVMTATTETLTLSGTSIQGSIVFAAAGDSATLIYIGSKWYMIGGTAAIS